MVQKNRRQTLVFRGLPSVVKLVLKEERFFYFVISVLFENKMQKGVAIISIPKITYLAIASLVGKSRQIVIPMIDISKLIVSDFMLASEKIIIVSDIFFGQTSNPSESQRYMLQSLRYRSCTKVVTMRKRRILLQEKF